jgi:hypothetical protein
MEEVFNHVSKLNIDSSRTFARQEIKQMIIKQ